MEIIHSVEDLKGRIRRAHEERRSIGLVPTMGALHAGHMSLIDQARKDNDLVVVSVFVNPTQFGPNEDYAAYPRDLARDAKKCREAGVDVVFAPAPEEMYPPGYGTHVDTDGVTAILEGATRPGHFKGVTTVVLKLFNLVTPTRAYFGMKDYQQLVVIRKMVRDLNVDVDVVGMLTIREPDGLAMSSRNAYLSPEERKAATILYRVLLRAGELVRAGQTDAAQIRSQLEEMIHAEPLAEMDYIAIADPDTLEPIAEIQGVALVALAVKIGATRLIDNMIVSV